MIFNGSQKVVLNYLEPNMNEFIFYWIFHPSLRDWVPSPWECRSNGFVSPLLNVWEQGIRDHESTHTGLEICTRVLLNFGMHGGAEMLGFKVIEHISEHTLFMKFLTAAVKQWMCSSSVIFHAECRSYMCAENISCPGLWQMCKSSWLHLLINA